MCVCVFATPKQWVIFFLPFLDFFPLVARFCVCFALVELQLLRPASFLKKEGGEVQSMAKEREKNEAQDRQWTLRCVNANVGAAF